MWGERGAGLVTFDDDICLPAFHDDVHYNSLKGGKANFSFRDFEPDFLHQYLLKY